MKNTVSVGRQEKIKFKEEYKQIISLNNLLQAWQEFIKGKRGKRDVQKFSFYFMDNIISLHSDLFHHIYKHGEYQAFNISDPKPRNIHKANVRDRLLHHAIYRRLYSFFDKIFIFDLFSCRLNKGTYKAINRFREFAYKASKNNSKTCWILKGDIKKFFASIDHALLLDILRKHISDRDILLLLKEVIGSFSSSKPGIGLPLGNLTSQLFVNIYMNELDRFIKHILKVKYYIRYADDFVILSENKDYLENITPLIDKFLKDKLKLELHPNKVFIKTLNSGVDFLGWVNFFNFRVLRAATKSRMIKRIKSHPMQTTLNSYLSLLRHGNTKKLQAEIKVLVYLEKRTLKC